MSTKIYNAYKYDGNLDSLFVKLKELRKKYQELQIEKFSHLGNLKIPCDGVEVKLNDLGDEILGEMYFTRFLEDRMRQGINEAINIEASVVIYPYKNNLYVHFFGLNDKLINNIDGLIDYHYQNQCDMSNYDWDKENWEDMSPERQKELEDDWDERKKIWDDILGYDAPSESGFLFNFHPVGYNMTMFCSNVIQKIKERYEKTTT